MAMSAIALLLFGCAAQAPGDSIVYSVAPSSRFEVQTGKAGLLGFAGHEHLIRARAFSGRIVYRPAAPGQSHVEIVVPTESLEVLTPPDTEEIRKVTEAMRSEVLHVAEYPEITFVSKAVTPIDGGFRLLADLTLAGQTHEVSVDVRVALEADTLRATTAFSVKQTEFGIKPYRGGPAGTVRVADRVKFQIETVGIRERGP
jgi:polyisoprenoid-binding protein YceI